MSSLGAIPGFAFPLLDYGETEFFETVLKLSTGVGSFSDVLVQGGNGRAFYVDSVRSDVTADATVGTRQATLLLVDPDGNQASFIRQGLTPGAGGVATWQWLSNISASSIVGNTSYSPMHNVIILPGWSLRYFFTRIGAGDLYTNPIAIGRAIPVSGRGAPVDAAIPTPLFV